MKGAVLEPRGASLEEALPRSSVQTPSLTLLAVRTCSGCFSIGLISFTCRGRPGVRLPDGRLKRTPEEVLAIHGLAPGQRQVLDPAKGLIIVSWQRARR